MLKDTKESDTNSLINNDSEAFRSNVPSSATTLTHTDDGFVRDFWPQGKPTAWPGLAKFYLVFPPVKRQAQGMLGCSLGLARIRSRWQFQERQRRKIETRTNSGSCGSVMHDKHRGRRTQVPVSEPRLFLIVAGKTT